MPELAARLIHLEELWEQRFPFSSSIRVISGYRTAEQQRDLELQGRPAAADMRSTHRSCPATGADLQLPLAVTANVKAELGHLAILAGLRWGGGSTLDDTGLPVDWNHVDLGPRHA